MKNIIKHRFNEEMKDMLKAWDKTAWDEKEVYANWIAQTYYYVCHSTRLLALSASRFSLGQQKLHNRFLAHLGEEKGHEVMAQRDLAALGFKLEDFPELPELSAFYQTQYYWVEHVHPVSFIGYILCLEGLAVLRGKDLYQQMAKNFGEKAAVFLKVHAEEDVEHLDKAFALIENADAKELEYIFENMKLSCSLYKEMLVKINSSKIHKTKAA